MSRRQADRKECLASPRSCNKLYTLKRKEKGFSFSGVGYFSPYLEDSHENS